MQLGKVALKLFKDTKTLPAAGPTMAGEILYTAGFLVAIIFWGFGLVWLFFALASIATTSRFPFVSNFLQSGSRSKLTIMIEHGMVGFHFPAGRLRCQYNYIGARDTFSVLQGARYYLLACRGIALAGSTVRNLARGVYRADSGGTVSEGSRGR